MRSVGGPSFKTTYCRLVYVEWVVPVGFGNGLGVLFSYPKATNCGYIFIEAIFLWYSCFGNVMTKVLTCAHVHLQVNIIHGREFHQTNLPC